MGTLKTVKRRVGTCACRLYLEWRRAGQTLREEAAQGTTEYAILVGVLVIIAIGAIILLRPIVQGLWDEIVSKMGELESGTSA